MRGDEWRVPSRARQGPLLVSEGQKGSRGAGLMRARTYGDKKAVPRVHSAPSQMPTAAPDMQG